MASKKVSQLYANQALKLSSSELLAALSYATDVTPSGSHYHAWRVALVSQHIAGVLAPDIQRDAFYAGLLHDVGGVGSYKHLSQYVSQTDQVNDPHIKSHPQRGSALVKWLPGMGAAAQYVASHHEWWNGRGYPDGKPGEAIPLGSLIVGATSAADVAGCFKSSSSLRSVLPTLSSLTGHAWSQDIWATLVRSTQDAAFYSAIANPDDLHRLMAEKVVEFKAPAELATEEGIERILHLFAALVDMKDPSTSGHSLRTARRAQVLAKFMELSDEEARTAYRAGLIHDIGRLGLEGYILNKTGRLTSAELDIVRKHAEMTIRVMGCLPNSQEMTMLGQIGGHDHERYDSHGYPDRLPGESIPMISRILGVVDAYDSMISSNEYRLLTPKGAVLRITQNAGTQFDPNVAQAMAEAVNAGAFDEKVKVAA